MMKFTLAALAIALATANKAYALGINCRGSAECGGGRAYNIVQYIEGISDDAWYADGQHIACDQSICAFLQDTNGASGSSIKALAPYIIDHGCTSCGSVPTGYPQDNNVADGQLTFNYVTNPCGPGICY
ncbi:killer toxin [Mycena latifolia]|nr:killer toxin [Mycena latifolia]